MPVDTSLPISIIGGHMSGQQQVALREEADRFISRLFSLYTAPVRLWTQNSRYRHVCAGPVVILTRGIPLLVPKKHAGSTCAGQHPAKPTGPRDHDRT